MHAVLYRVFAAPAPLLARLASRADTEEIFPPPLSGDFPTFQPLQETWNPTRHICCFN